MNPKLAKLLSLTGALSLALSACAAAAPAAPTAAPAKPTEAAKPAATPLPATAGKVFFYSTQGNTVNEAEAIRKQVLNTFKGEVELVTEASGPFLDKIAAENKAGKGTVDVAAGLVGDISPLIGQVKAGNVFDDPCRDWRTLWPATASRLKPDGTLLVFGSESSTRLIDGTWREACDPIYDTWHTKVFTDALATMKKLSADHNRGEEGPHARRHGDARPYKASIAMTCQSMRDGD